MTATAVQDITPTVVAEHGLSADEYQEILSILGREPNLLELGIFAVMWSEHCSYKTTKKWLKTLPTEAEHVICGPGENAGVIDIGDGQAAIFKMESHNHPSFIEPHQGAATGVGGILRDVFTMGARPIANMNALRFGSPDHPKTRHLISGVVSGISSYGNCVGVPTVGGECIFHPAYNTNNLVNAMTVGIADADNIFYSAAAGIGNSVVYVGSKTGRDGIHGATMASAEFDDDTEEKRPTVQVGDPFTEKLLIEACLELMATDAIIAIQDMGAAGLTCSSLEMAGKGGCGIELNIENVPMREKGMTPYEVMLSESQERMLMVLKPGKEKLAKDIFTKWELDFAIVGHITDTGKLIVKHHGEVAGEIPVAAVEEASPEYDRPYVATPNRPVIEHNDVPAKPIMESLKALLATPDLSSKRWIWEQYDHMVMNDTIARPGGDAAIVRVHRTEKALAISSDVTPRYCFATPFEGGKQAVAETWRNITATGATPMAITNCLNFGNPEKPDIMGQLVGCINGMSEACRELEYPVISGNVSLYNETNGKGILPTPTISGVGIFKDLSKRANGTFAKEGQTIFLIGETKGHMGASLYLREIEGKEEGNAPEVDLTIEKQNGDFIRSLIEEQIVITCHDLSDGGLLVALAEMTFDGIGAKISLPNELPAHIMAFAEDQARYLIAVDDAEAIRSRANEPDIAITELGKTVGDWLVVNGETLSITELKELNEAWLPYYMAD